VDTLKQISALKMAQQWFNQHRLPERADDVKAEHVIKSIEIALAEQSAQPESELITATQARELGSGNAEWRFFFGRWAVIGKNHPWFDGAQYRAIKQVQP
jgi:3-methyladenine DNA glycosylase AlkC